MRDTSERSSKAVPRACVSTRQMRLSAIPPRWNSPSVLRVRRWLPAGAARPSAARSGLSTECATSGGGTAAAAAPRLGRDSRWTMIFKASRAGASVSSYSSFTDSGHSCENRTRAIIQRTAMRIPVAVPARGQGEEGKIERRSEASKSRLHRRCDPVLRSIAQRRAPAQLRSHSDCDFAHHCVGRALRRPAAGGVGGCGRRLVDKVHDAPRSVAGCAGVADGGRGALVAAPGGDTLQRELGPEVRALLSAHARHLSARHREEHRRRAQRTLSILRRCSLRLKSTHI